MEREHGRLRNRSAEKHGVMTNGGGGLVSGFMFSHYWMEKKQKTFPNQKTSFYSRNTSREH